MPGGRASRPSSPPAGWTWRPFCQFGIQLAEIVRGLHHRKLIHKDINPNNILVDPETGRLALIDFSIASRMPAEAPGPAPPERARRHDRVPVARADRQDEPGHRLPDRLLFPGRDVLRDADRPPPLRVRRSARGDSRTHRENPSLAPRTWRPEIPPPLSDMVMKLLAKAAEERYQSAAGLEVGPFPVASGVGSRARRSARWRRAGATSAIASWFPSDSTAASGSSRSCWTAFERVGRRVRASSCWSPAMPGSERRR